MRNASQQKDIRRYEKQAREDEIQRINFIVAAMSTVAGRVWFHNLLAQCHIFADPFTGDALLEAYNKGERNVGLRLYTDIVSNAPDYFIAMMKEATVKEEINVRRADLDTDDPDDDGSTGGEYPGSSD